MRSTTCGRDHCLRHLRHVVDAQSNEESMGLLLFIGLNFLADWLVDGWRVLSHRDYALMILLLLIVVGYGFVAGVLVGMALIFVSNPDVRRRRKKERRLVLFQVDDGR